MVTLKKKGDYRKPRRINAVSIGLLIFLAFCGYVGWSFWPVLQLNANVKNVLDDYMPQVYRSNLWPEPDRSKGLTDMKNTIIKKVKALEGMKDPHFEVYLKADRVLPGEKTHGKKRIFLRVDFKTQVYFQWLERRYWISLHPSLDTDAERVQWD